MNNTIRNITIIAHVDHGKTTLVDKIIDYCKVLDDRKERTELLLDNNDLERERGITILSKNVSVVYKDLYAGTIDLIGMNDGKLCLVDYKSSYRSKSKEEMEEYFLQLAAYSIAHDWQYNTKINSLIILLAIRNGQFEKTSISNDELDIYKSKWLSRLEKFQKTSL